MRYIERSLSRSRRKEDLFRKADIMDAIEDHFGKYANGLRNEYSIWVGLNEIRNDGTIELGVHWSSTNSSGIQPEEIDDFIKELTKVKSLCKTFDHKG